MYLGIDLGTSGVKVILATSDQHIVTSATVALSVSRPYSGWSEQNPDDWIESTRRAILEIKDTFPGELMSVRAIGLSGQMHGATLLDSADQVIRPCILWNDTRSHIEANELDNQPMFREISGNVVFPGFTAPKLRWLSRNEPGHFRKTAKILLPKDYLRLWLTGESVSDMSDASGTSWLDVGKRSWSPELLASCDLGVEQMPALVEGTEVSGKLRPVIADELGLSKNVVVAGGAGDNAASAMAAGTINAGEAFISIGTSGVVFAANDSFLPNPQSAVHAFCHALPERWHQMGVILSATAALKWFANIVGSSEQTLTSELGSSLRAPGAALFLPYLAGERTPHNDALVRGAFRGLGAEMDRQALTQAVLEGVSFAFRDNLEALRSAGTNPTAMIAVGGGMNSIYWMRVIATAMNLPIAIPERGDLGAAFGAVRLAMLADEVSSPEELCLPPPVSETILPSATHRPAFEEAYQRFRNAYDNEPADNSSGNT